MDSGLTADLVSGLALDVSKNKLIEEEPGPDYECMQYDRNMHWVGLTIRGAPYQRKAGALFSYAKSGFSYLWRLATFFSRRYV